MKRLLMMIGAAAIVAMADVALATDLDSYCFRYDFSAGTKKFCGSDEFSVDPLSDTKINSSDRADMVVLPIDGPDGANTAAHPMNTGWSAGNSSANSMTVYSLLSEGDWTCAMSVRPGMTPNGVLFSMGRRSADNRKGISICASSNPNEMIVDENIRVATNKKSQRSSNVLNNGVDVSSGFHTVVVVYRKPASGYAGTAEFYIDGVYQKSITTANYEFGGGFQFCSTISDLHGSEKSTTEDLDVAFRDVRFYSSAFTSTDARRYAALYPAGGKLRQSAYVRAYGANAVDTGYSVTPQTRIGIDCQYTDLTTGRRMFGAGEYNHDSLGCAFYIQGQGNFAHIFNDGYDYTDSALGNKNTATRQRVKAVLDRPAGYSYLWKDGAKTTDKQTGTASGDYAATTTLPLFAEKSTTVTQNCANAMIYSVDIQESGRLVHFFAPHYDETFGACFKDIVTGVLKGEIMESPATELSYTDGFGSSADYKYENGTLYAKVYVDSVNTAQGTVAVSASGETLTPEEDGSYWVAYNTTLTLAATPESGYAFAGWAGDVNAIQSGTTSQTGMTILIDRATQFEARFSLAPDVEIFHTSAVGAFAKRAQDFNVGDYVQTGLILHYDGKRNAGADAEHSADATTWANLGSLGSANDATLKTLGSNIPSGATAGLWGEDGYAFGGKNYFAIPAAVLGGAVTVQIAADYDDGKQLVLYPALFGQTSSNDDNFMVYFNRNWGNDTDNCKLRFKMLNNGQHGAKSVWSGPFATVIYDTARDASEGVSVGNGDVPDWQTRNVSGSNPSYTYAIGATKNTDKNRKDRMLVGTVKSIRVYTQVLDDEALIWNRFVDEVRYGDCAVDVDFVVAADSRGLEGVEGAGEYMVNGTHTFSATNLTDGVFAWSPVGYRLDKWNGTDWVFDSYGEGDSYTYTNCAANGKMRLTWIWKQTGQVMKYDAGDYIQYDRPSTLLAHYDGILNAGAEHETSPSNWVNLVAGGFNLATNNAPSFSADAWVADGASYFSTTSTAVKEALKAKNFTLELMISHPGGQVKNEYGSWVYIGDNYSDKRQLVVDLREPNSKNPLVQGVQYRESGWNNDRSALKTSAVCKWKTRQYVAVVCDKDGATTYCDGTQIHHTDGGSREPDDANVTIGAYKTGATQLNPNAEICAIRMTAGALAPWQLEYNNAIDQVRFNGNVTIVNGAVGETGNVGSSSATDGVYDVASGTWTITAEPVKVGDKTYHPRLTVETLTDGEWVQKEKRWTDSYTVDKAKLDSSRIRLTWTWAIRPGLLISFH